MRFARFHAMGEAPEDQAFHELMEWAKPAGILAQLADHPIYGFNNPPPQPGFSDYGYEFWVRIESDFELPEHIDERNFPGGLFAVTTIHGFPNSDAWMEHWQEVEEAGYKLRRAHELERLQDPMAKAKDMISELYLPIEEA